MVELAGLEVAMKLYLSAVIKFVMHVNIKNGQHTHKEMISSLKSRWQ